MKIFIDIGHPAHVHYFRNLVKSMSVKGHQFFVTARDKEVTFSLLDHYNIAYRKRGSGGKGILGKILYLLKADFIVTIYALKFRPDIFLSFASPYAAHAAFFLRRDHIALDDTEAARFGQAFYLPFTATRLNPASFRKNFRGTQIRYDSFTELCYLHPGCFVPDRRMLDQLDLHENEEYVIIRLVSWQANHDFGQSGITPGDLALIIEELKGRFRIFISSEGELDERYNKYKIKISPEKIHHVLAFATLFIGEGATMASECAMLGTPAIYVNSITAGTLEEQEKLGLLYGFRDSSRVMDKIRELLLLKDLKKIFIMRRTEMLKTKIACGDFLQWFIEDYPESRNLMIKDQSIQYRFLRP